ncbi:MAG TPA: hypothetical protein VIN07_03505 [Flavipsychrobacter sp.]
MAERDYTGIIPPQEEGTEIKAEESRDFDNTDAAKAAYENAKQRLLRVNGWHDLGLRAEFQLVNVRGEEVDGPASKGLYFRIDIPGPGTIAGDGYDWVCVVQIAEYNSPDIQSIALQVKPAPNPTEPEPETTHFYSDKSTSTFTVTREGNKLTAAVYDRNIEPNTESERIPDKLRNAVIGTAGMTIFSKLEWEDLAYGLVTV